MTEKSTLEIKFNNLWVDETFKDLLWTSIPFESVAEVLKAYYAYKLWVYINESDYDRIKELEGILELHNLIQGKIDNI